VQNADKLAGQAGGTRAVDGVDGMDGVDGVDPPSHGFRRRQGALARQVGAASAVDGVDGQTAAIRQPDSAWLALITQARIAFKYGLSTGKGGKMGIFARA